MSDDYQIHIPPSFFALYADRRGRLTVPLQELRERYEVCEDLAQHLVDHANHRSAHPPGAEADVLLRYHRGLCASEAGTTPPEATWVVRRLAELLGWDCPPLDAPD